MNEGPRTDDRQPPPDLPVLPMLPEHVGWIMRGTKTSTLRTKMLCPALKVRGARAGFNWTPYRLEVKGQIVATVNILTLDSIRWTSLTVEAQNQLAKFEGYPNRDAFVDIMIELSRRRMFRHLIPFMSGRSELWLHSIKILEHNPTLCVAFGLLPVEAVSDQQPPQNIPTSETAIPGQPASKAVDDA